MKSHRFFTTCTNTRSKLKFPANITATFPVTLILKHTTQSWPNLRDLYRMHDLRISPHPLYEAEKTLSIARNFCLMYCYTTCTYRHFHANVPCLVGSLPSPSLYELPRNTRNTYTHRRNWFALVKSAFAHFLNFCCCVRFITNFMPFHSITKKIPHLRAWLAPILHKVSHINSATLRNRAQQVIFTRNTLFSRSQIWFALMVRVNLLPSSSLSRASTNSSKFPSCAMTSRLTGYSLVVMEVYGVNALHLVCNTSACLSPTSLMPLQILDNSSYSSYSPQKTLENCSIAVQFEHKKY